MVIQNITEIESSVPCLIINISVNVNKIHS